jgi:hypothetical protein
MFAKELELKKAGEVETKECEKLLETETAKAAELKAEAEKVGRAHGMPHRRAQLSPAHPAGTLSKQRAAWGTEFGSRGHTQVHDAHALALRIVHRTPHARNRPRAGGTQPHESAASPRQQDPTPAFSFVAVFASAQMGITPGAAPRRDKLDKEKEELIALRLQLERCKAESELLHHQVRRRAPVKS